jgi:hypothetical protein
MELDIQKEPSYVISVINPKRPAPTAGYPSTEEPPKYPEEMLREFSEIENFSLSRDTKLIDYQNAQIILIGAREGRNVIKNGMAIEIAEEKSSQSAGILNKLKVRKDQVPIKPLTEGKLE